MPARPGCGARSWLSTGEPGREGTRYPPNTHTRGCPRNTDPRDLVTALHDGSARRWGVAGDFRGSASSRVPLPGQGPRITEPGKGPSRRLDTQALKADLMAGIGHLFHPSPSGSCGSVSPEVAASERRWQSRALGSVGSSELVPTGCPACRVQLPERAPAQGQPTKGTPGWLGRMEWWLAGPRGRLRLHLRGYSS